MGHVEVPALAGVSLDVHEGEFVAIVGPSGSGKSTMMNILGCLDRPTAGTYELAGTPVGELDDDGLAHLRSRTIGFVFQSYNLLPRTSALDNVATPLLYQGVTRAERTRRATAALERLGPRRPADPRADRALRRPAAARGRGPGDRHRAGARSSRTSPRATSTATPAPRSSRCSASSTPRAGPSSSSPTTPRSPRPPAGRSTCATDWIAA